MIQPAGDPDQAGFYRLPAITQENLPGHSITADGSTVLLLRFSKPGAAALRLHLEDLHLPEGATLFIYTLDNSGQIVSLDSPAGNVPDYWTPALTGDTAVVEVDWQNEIPGDVPFRVSELRESDPSGAPAAASTGETFTGQYRGHDMTYTVVDGLAMVEGDIILGRHGQLGASGKDNGQRDGVGITGSWFRWPNGIIPYSIPAGFPNQQRIYDAISHWNTMLSGVIQFVPRTTQSNYVTFYTSGGCSSIVGMNSIGAHPVYLSDGCTTGNVIHELGHIVGLWHEQSREDRDQHVRVLWQNVDPNASFNFSQNIYNGDDLGPYDFNSIMHYPTFSFSKNGQPTLETIPAGIPIGQRTALSAGDINAVRTMYGASVSTPPAPISTPTPAPTPAPTTPSLPTTTPSTPVPATLTVALQTNPSGQVIRVDGANYTAPATVYWTAGSAHTVEAVNPIPGTSVIQFARWSDGGTQSHSVTASSTLTVLKADFSLSYAVSAATYPSSAGTVSLSPQTSSGLYAAGSVLSVTANPSSGYCFTGWSGLLGGTPSSTSLTVNGAVSVTANFTAGSVSLGSQMYYAPAAGGSTSVSISSPAGSCGWNAFSYSSWVSLSGARGVGSGTLTVNVAPNTTGMFRSAMLLIGGRGFVVSQPAY